MGHLGRIVNFGALRGVAMLALVVFAFVLARPVCEAFGFARVAPSVVVAAADAEHDHGEAGRSSHDRDSCCDTVRDIALVSPAGATGDDKEAAGAVLIASTAAAFTLLPRGRPAAIRPAWDRPRPLPYHARTARILA